jgi:hypothetical protein
LAYAGYHKKEEKANFLCYRMKYLAKLHIIAATYWRVKTILIPERTTIGSKQYPSTDTTVPRVTPDTAIRLSKAYIARQPITPMP